MEFPCPRTYLPESEDDLKRIAEEVGFPLVIKLRFTSAGRGMETVKDFQELLGKTSLIKESQGMPMLQEYILGKEKRYFHLMLDKMGKVKVPFCVKDLRCLPRVYQSIHTARKCTVPHSYVMHVTRLLQKLGWWGGATVETKVDPRDGLPKLMEINPRLGYRLWERTELGINEPLMCIKIARGEEIEAVKDLPVGTVLLDPIEDMLGLGFRLLDLLIYKFRIGIQKKAPVDPLNPPMTLRELIRSYKQTYLGSKKKVCNPYFRYFFQDPLVSLVWWLASFMQVIKATKQLGQ